MAIHKPAALGSLAAGAIACCTAAGLAQPAGAPSAPAPHVAGDQPNFLIIISDDHSWFDVGAYGNEIVQTPNIDRLASQGMVFDQAFTPVPMCAPSRSALMTGLYPVRNGAWPNHAAIYPDVRTVPQELQDLGYRTALAGKTHIKPAEQFPFEYLTEDQGPEFLSTVEDGEPFLLVIATRQPHVPWPRNEDYDPQEIELPPFLVDTETTRDARARYYQGITVMDEIVGEALDALEAEGFADETVVIFAGDQGASFPFEKWSLYDHGTKVPFVVRWPGEVEPGTRTEAMVSFVDVLPTLVEIAGGTAPEGVDGESIVPVLRGQASEHRDAVYGVQTNYGIITDPDPFPIRSIRTDRYKYIANLAPENTVQNMLTEPRPWPIWRSWREIEDQDPFAAKQLAHYRNRPAEELYDLAHDPWEMNNLADDPHYQEVKAELAARLRAWMSQQGDKGLETELQAKERQDAAPNNPDARQRARNAQNN